MLAATNTKALWYLTRGTGIVCLLLLTASVVLGVLEVKRWASPRWPRFVTAGLHKNISLLVVAFVAVHVVTAVTDSFAPIRWLDVFVPFISRYRPIWLGFGALAADLLIAVIVTSLLRARIGATAWRAVHWLTYLCWPVALVHGIGTGTDARHGWVLVLALVCLVIVLASVWWRLAGVASEWTGIRSAAAALSVAVPLVILSWLVVGPLKPGWAARAGTPAALVATSTGAAAAPIAAPTEAPTPGLQAPFNASLTGTVAESIPDAQGSVTLVIDGTLTAGASGQLHISMHGPFDDQGGLVMQRSSVTLGPNAQHTEYRGQITKIQGSQVVASLRSGSGPSLVLTVSMQIDSRAHLTGSVRLAAA